MSDALEAELDELFQLPASEMVAARNVLVSRLKKAGEREAATRVTLLKRPAPAAWAINQIYFQARELLELALADVARVRELQATEGVDRQQLVAAVATQRVSLQAVVDAALRNLAAAGLPHAGPSERRVFATVQGWLGGSGDEAPGRMTRELEPSGFESVGVLGIPAPLPASGSAPLAASGSAPLAASGSAPLAASGSAPLAASGGAPLAASGGAPLAASGGAPLGASGSAPPAASPPRAAQSTGAASLPLLAVGEGVVAAAPLAAAGPQRAANRAASAGPKLMVVPNAPSEPPAPDPAELARRAREQAEARVFESKQACEWAEGRLAEQRKKQSVAEQAVERAKHEVEDAERALALRRAALSERQTELTRRQEEVAEADRAHNAAKKALDAARADLAKL